MMTPSMTSCKRLLYTDIETYSGEDIKSAGAFRYMEAPDFRILLLAYAYDDDPVEVLDLTEGKPSEILDRIREDLRDPSVLKISHNCAFERNAYHRAFLEYLPPEQWLDTMILCAYNGLPMSLDAAGAALGLPEQKTKEGVSLINYFCKPCKPTKANGGRTRNLPYHEWGRWQHFREYAKRDVEVMRTIYKRLNTYKATPLERRIFALDAHINERGVQVDVDFARSAIAVDELTREQLSDELRHLTGLANPNSVAQLKDWLESVGLPCDSLSKETVAELLAATSDPRTRRVLQLRQQLGKTSVKKYEAMTNSVCSDGRVRSITQYYGAGRTGRWAGRLVQLQNLPQNHLEDIGTVRGIVAARDTEALELLYDSTADVLSQLIRTAFVAPPGCTFVVCDYSAIEARVIAYLAGEQWRQEVFANGGDIYCSSASAMFKLPVEKHGINGHLRQKGKIAELACGYGGGVGALMAFGADKMGLTEDEMQTIVTQWRNASPTIPALWRSVEKAARAALESRGRTVKVNGKVHDPDRARRNEASTGAESGSYSEYFDSGYTVCEYRRDKDALRCRLPSGRVLTYWGAELRDNSITFLGQNQTTHKWERMETWGGRLVENIVQAFARDCLAVAMLRLEEAGWRIVFHVHDEVVLEAPKGFRWQDAAEIMGRPIDWAPGLLLRAEGYETDFYMKD